jgi:hypothetical protein
VGGGAIAFCIACEAFANAVRFVEIVTGAAFVDDAIAVVVEVVAAALVFAVIRWCWAIARDIAY